MKWLFIIWLCVFTAAGNAEEIELGMGTGSIYFPAYIGSKTTQSYTVPFPYIVYRSDYLTVDKDGVTGKLFDIDGLGFDVSMGGTLPAGNTKLREGMPPLDLTFEVGPKIVYRIFEKGVSSLCFELPVRGVFSTDFHKISAQGYVVAPQLKYELKYEHLDIALRTAWLYGDAEYHRYFYEVLPKYATEDRDQYTAKGGYNSIKVKVTGTYKKGSWWTGAFVSYHDISSAVFADSPLVETTHALYMGLSVAYIFWASK